MAWNGVGEEVGEELGGVGKGETVIRIYYVKKYFQLKNNNYNPLPKKKTGKEYSNQAHSPHGSSHIQLLHMTISHD